MITTSVIKKYIRICINHFPSNGVAIYISVSTFFCKKEILRTEKNLSKF